MLLTHWHHRHLLRGSFHLILGTASCFASESIALPGWTLFWWSLGFPTFPSLDILSLDFLLLRTSWLQGSPSYPSNSTHPVWPHSSNSSPGRAQTLTHSGDFNICPFLCTVTNLVPRRKTYLYYYPCHLNRWKHWGSKTWNTCPNSPR